MTTLRWTNAAASDNATVIQQGWAQGTTTLFEVESIFFQFNAPTAPHPGCQLRSDYAARWQAAVPTIQELVTSGAVIGFMMGAAALTPCSHAACDGPHADMCWLPLAQVMSWYGTDWRWRHLKPLHSW